tara:strand:+ start:118 stop:390 length:273 start_codon:yes stop_codon:yes gene_type:complete
MNNVNPIQINSNKVYLILGIFSTISFLAMVFLLIPISTQSDNFNKCVKTTGSFLLTIPGFKDFDKQGINAMSVSLCNGSTPQNRENSVRN